MRLGSLWAVGVLLLVAWRDDGLDGVAVAFGVDARLAVRLLGVAARVAAAEGLGAGVATTVADLESGALAGALAVVVVDTLGSGTGKALAADEASAGLSGRGSNATSSITAASGSVGPIGTNSTSTCRPTAVKNNGRMS